MGVTIEPRGGDRAISDNGDGIIYERPDGSRYKVLKTTGSVWQPPTPAAPPVRTPPIVQEEPVSTILDTITNLGTQYINQRYGPGAPAPRNVDLLPAEIPFYDVIPEAGQACGVRGRQVWDPHANCGQGKWVTRRRRRRRRLATQSDIKDLAALKSVLGGGKALENWINTH